MWGYEHIGRRVEAVGHTAAVGHIEAVVAVPTGFVADTAADRIPGEVAAGSTVAVVVLDPGKRETLVIADRLENEVAARAAAGEACYILPVLEDRGTTARHMGPE